MINHAWQDAENWAIHLHRGTVVTKPTREASAQACLTAYGCHSPQAEAIIHCKDKEEAKLVHDRGHHAPEESAHLGNCFSPSPSLNRGSLKSLLWQHLESCLVSPLWGNGRSRAQRYSPGWGNGRSRAQWEKNLTCLASMSTFFHSGSERYLQRQV